MTGVEPTITSPSKRSRELSLSFKMYNGIKSHETVADNIRLSLFRLGASQCSAQTIGWHATAISIGTPYLAALLCDGSWARTFTWEKHTEQDRLPHVGDRESRNKDEGP